MQGSGALVPSNPRGTRTIVQSHAPPAASALIAASARTMEDPEVPDYHSCKLRMLPLYSQDCVNADDAVDSVWLARMISPRPSSFP